MIDKMYRYLGHIKTPGHALILAGILAGGSSLLSLFGTILAVETVGSPSQPFFQILSYLMPFTLILAFSFVLIRSISILDGRYKQLERAVDLDDLTRLANRKAFKRCGAEMAARADLQRTPLTLIMIDADHFKTINDTYGHLAGDLALQHLGKILRECCRDSDFVARWGGEEFAVLLHGASGGGARMFAERLREKVAQEPFYWKSKPVQVTLSAGLAKWNHGSDSFEKLVYRADKALYDAKANGRNQVYLSSCMFEQIEGYEQDVEFCDAAA